MGLSDVFSLHHPTTFFRASPAGFRTTAAMVHVMFFTFCGTVITEFGAQRTNFFCIMAPKAH
jgi:hypothetical protein